MIVSVKKRECLFWYALVVMQIFILLVTVKSNRVAIATLLRVPVRGFFYVTNTPGYTGGSKKLTAMSRKKEPPLVIYSKVRQPNK